MYTLTTFRSVPSFAVGHVRDLRVRWALEEAGQSYDVRLIGFEDKETPAYRREQPFAQVPVLRDGDMTLFETGAILLHLGARHPVLLPRAEEATMWTFAALNSVEPYVGNLANLVAFSMDQPWAQAQRPVLEEIALKRLGQVNDWLDGRDWLAGEFSVADIVMTTVVRLLDGMGYVERFARLSAWRDRCTARPAYRKALADQVAQFTQTAAA